MTKENYQAVLDQVDHTLDSLNVLEVKVDEANPEAIDIIAKFNIMEDTLLEIHTWAQQNINKLNQEVVINSFLIEIKAVFEKYDAKLEVGSGDAGYGLNYGEGESVGVKFSATLDGVTGVKEIAKSVIVAEDLV